MKKKGDLANGTHSVPSFTAPTENHIFDGLLFDLDGTIIDSTDAIVKHWQKIGNEIGVDPEVILADSHGRRSIETLAIYDKSRANWEYVSEIEGRIPFEYGRDAATLPGAGALLEQLRKANATWTIVTSGTRPLCEGWLTVMKLAQPVIPLVVAEDVENGKPDPSCYLLGRKRLGVGEEAKCLVFEDSPAGVKAGKAAGFQVVAVATTHDAKVLKERGADWIVEDLRSVKLVGRDNKTGKMTIEIKDALVDKERKKETSSSRQSTRVLRKRPPRPEPVQQKRRRAAKAKSVAKVL